MCSQFKPETSAFGGITSDVCFMFRSSNALSDGFEVRTVMDACGSPFELSQKTSRHRTERGGVWSSATNMMTELVQVWWSPEDQFFKADRRIGAYECGSLK